MPTTCIDNLLTPIWHRVNYVLDLFLWNSLPHCHDRCLKIVELLKLIQVQALLHQPPYVLDWVQIRTVSWVNM